MTDEAACASMSLGPPQVSVAALIDLRAVLSLALDTVIVLGIIGGKRKGTIR